MGNSTIAKFYDADMRPPRGGWECMIEGRPFNGRSETGTFDEIKRWRANNGTYKSDFAIWEEMWAWFRAREPERQTLNFEPGDPRPVSSDGTDSRSWQQGEGPELWRELHRDAANHVRDNDLSPSVQFSFLATFARAIRCPECRMHWNGIVAMTPPDLSSADNYFAWTVAAHNLVNDRVGHPQFLLSRARELYGLPT